MITKEVKVLDKGYIKLLNIASQEYKPIVTNFNNVDGEPAIAARMSFDNKNKTFSKKANIGLDKYLIKNHHNTPIEMVETWWEMKLPIFVARQLIRHRTSSVTEASGRYIELPPDWYIPDEVGKASPQIKQGQASGLNKVSRWCFRNLLNLKSWIGYKLYQFFMRIGVAREHARLVLGLNHYTKWVFKQDLHNLLWLLKLRKDSHAQVEAQAYARAMISQLKDHAPEVLKTIEGMEAEEELKEKLLQAYLAGEFDLGESEQKFKRKNSPEVGLV